MGNITENKEQVYDWDIEQVYLIEEDDYVEGGEDGVSNRPAKQLTHRTRDLFNRIGELLKKVIKGDSDVLDSATNHTNTTATQTLATANSHTNTTAQTLRSEISTTATNTLTTAKNYADTAVSALVDSSPDTLNTLNELAAALGDDPNFATTVANQIGTKVDKTDPRLSNARPANGGTANFLQWLSPEGVVQHGHYLKFIRTHPLDANARLYLQGENREYDSIEVAYATRAGSSEKIGLYSATDLFINNGADNSDINNLPACSGMWAVNHDGGGQNLPFPFGAVIQFAGARGAGGYPIFQMASRAGGENFYVRSKWHNETLGANGWKELYHSGNFNPATKADKTELAAKADKTELAAKANDRDIMKVLRAGKIGADGEKTKMKGWFTSTRLGSMIYRVTHDIGHTDYMTLASCVHPNQVHDISVISETANYTEFLIGGTSGTSYSAFNFTILEI